MQDCRLYGLLSTAVSKTGTGKKAREGGCKGWKVKQELKDWVWSLVLLVGLLVVLNVMFVD